jgi:hypothetical protein
MSSPSTVDRILTASRMRCAMVPFGPYHAEAKFGGGGCSRVAPMTDKAGRGFRSLGSRAFLTALVTLALSSCSAGYSQCLHNGGGALPCSVSSEQINQKANTLASCSGGDEDLCRTACGQTGDPQICDMWFTIKCPREPSLCRTACHFTHDQVACREACEAGDQAACIDYGQMVQRPAPVNCTTRKDLFGVMRTTCQ